jgi:hypothetical protein
MSNNKYTFAIIVLLCCGIFFLAPTFAAENRGKAAPDSLLPEEVKGKTVADYFVPGTGKQAGVITSTKGHVVVLHKDTGEAYFAAEGDTVFDQDVFFTLKGAMCRLKFFNADVISMAENTKISIDEMVADRKKKEKKSLVSIFRGKAMFFVVKLFKFRKTSATVNTPTAVCGVRGTKFAIEITQEASSSAQAVPVYLADLGTTASDAGPGFLLAAAETVTVTNFYVLDGTIVLETSDGRTFTLEKGESAWVDEQGNTWSGPTDPEKIEALLNAFGATGTTGGGGDGGDGGDTGDGGGNDEGETGDINQLNLMLDADEGLFEIIPPESHST